MKLPHTQKLPRTLLAINTALRARHAQGLSVEVVDVSGEPCRDEYGELFTAGGCDPVDA